MYRVLVRLQVKDFELFSEFERQAVQIMSEYDGTIVEALEITRNLNGTGEEVHLLEFPNVEAFDSYREDARHKSLAAMREQAIDATQIQPVLHTKSYR